MTDQTEAPETIEVGTRIYNHGDMANVPHWATVTTVARTEWGTRYGLTADAHASEFGEEFSRDSFDYTIQAEQVSPVCLGNGRSRFVTEAAYNEYRERKIAELKAAHAAQQN